MNKSHGTCLFGVIVTKLYRYFLFATYFLAWYGRIQLLEESQSTFVYYVSVRSVVETSLFFGLIVPRSFLFFLVHPIGLSDYRDLVKNLRTMTRPCIVKNRSREYFGMQIQNAPSYVIRQLVIV